MSATGLGPAEYLAPAVAPAVDGTGAAAPSSRRSLLRRLIRFGVIGASSTVAYLALYVALAAVLPALAANALALLITAVANTAANRRFTYGVRGTDDAAAQHAVGLVVFGLGLVFTTGALTLLHLVTDPDRAVELAALLAANLVVTVLRFLALDRLFTPAAARPTVAGE